MVLEGPGWVPGIAPPGTHPVPHTPGTPLPPWTGVHHAARSGSQVNMVVGLKSVAQLTLDGRFSRFQGITEGYNL